MQREVYVAFSIHGTNAFIVANTKIELAKEPEYNEIIQVPFFRSNETNIPGFFQEFRVGASRTRSQNDAIKLLSPMLEASNGLPIKDPKRIWHFFNILREFGWALTDAQFVRRHSLDIAKLRDERNDVLMKNNLNPYELAQFDYLVKDVPPVKTPDVSSITEVEPPAAVTSEQESLPVSSAARSQALVKPKRIRKPVITSTPPGIAATVGDPSVKPKRSHKKKVTTTQVTDATASTSSITVGDPPDNVKG